MGYIYLIENVIGNEVNHKIGFTTNLVRRLKELKTGNPGTMDIINYYETKWNQKLEFGVHREFKTNNTKGEWFKLSDNDVHNFKSICEKLEDSYNFLYEHNYFFKKDNLNKL